MKIRDMRLSDYDAVDNLMQQLHKLHVEGRPDLFINLEHPYSKEEFVQIIDDKEKITILAEEDSEVAGVCVVGMKNKSGMVEMRTAYIDDLIVGKRFRNKGYAKTLFHEATVQAKKRGAERLDLMVWSFNESALKLYESLGMVPQRYIYMRNLYKF